MSPGRWMGGILILWFHGLAGESLPVESLPVVAPSPSAEPESSWMDDTHEWTTEVLYRRVVWLDSMFYGTTRPYQEDPRSRFRVKLFTITDLQEPGGLQIQEELYASVRLPGLRDRFRLVLDSDELESFPTRGPEERADRNRLSLRRAGSWLDADVGAKISSPPRAFTRLTARTSGRVGPVTLRAQQRFFYDTDEGYGQVGSLSQHLWLGRHLMFGHGSSVRWSESTRGVEWQDSLTFARILGLVEQGKHGHFVGQSDMAHGVGLRLSASGHHDGSHVMDLYRVSLVYRRPLFRRNYLFLEVVPEVEWNNENDWEEVYTLKVGIDMLFWRDQ